MFEFACDQAAGLRTAVGGAPSVVMPVACTSRPGQAYEMLCAVATQLGAQGREVVIIDGSAQEVGASRASDGRHLGLLHALQDPSIGGLGAPGASSEWLVMPGAMGLQSLLQTASAAGASVALSRLLAPFSPGVVVLLYAPAAMLGALLAGSQARALVPVLDMPQATIDAYGSVKTLHAAGLIPVLAPMALALADARAPLSQVVRSVCDCTERYLGHSVEQWPMNTWGTRVQDNAVAAPWSPGEHLGAPKATDVNRFGLDAMVPNHWS